MESLAKSLTKGSFLAYPRKQFHQPHFSTVMDIITVIVGRGSAASSFCWSGFFGSSASVGRGWLVSWFAVGPEKQNSHKLFIPRIYESWRRTLFDGTRAGERQIMQYITLIAKKVFFVILISPQSVELDSITITVCHDIPSPSGQNVCCPHISPTLPWLASPLPLWSAFHMEGSSSSHK